MSLTSLQDALISRVSELGDYDLICTSLYSDGNVNEEHTKFWKRLLHQYCLEKGVITINRAMVYQDLTLPFVVPGDPYVYGSSDSTVKVYPESLEQSLEVLRDSKEILPSSAKDLTLDSLVRGEEGGGWFSTVFKALSPPPKKQAMEETYEFVPESVLALLSTLLLSTLPKVMLNPADPLVFFLDNPEADKICAKSTEIRLTGSSSSASGAIRNGGSELHPGPLTIQTLFAAVASSDAARGAGKDEGNEQSRRLLRRALNPCDESSSSSNSSGSHLTSAARCCDMLVSYMVTRGMAALDKEKSIVKFLASPASSTSASLSSRTTLTRDPAADSRSVVCAAEVTEVESANLTIRSTLARLHHASRDFEGRMRDKADAAREYVSKAQQTLKNSGDRATARSPLYDTYMRSARMYAKLHKQLQESYDTVTGSILRLEQAQLAIESNLMQGSVVESLSQATASLKLLNSGEEGGVSVEKAERVMDEFDEEMEDHAAISNELKSIIGGGANDLEDPELLAELQALEQDMSGLRVEDGSSSSASQQVEVSLPTAPQDPVTASVSQGFVKGREAVPS